MVGRVGSVGYRTTGILSQLPRHFVQVVPKSLAKVLLRMILRLRSLDLLRYIHLHEAFSELLHFIAQILL